MRFKSLAGALLVAAVLATPALAANAPKTSAAPPPLTPDYFCGAAHLSLTAHADCQEHMDKATTDDQRFKIERDFALGSVEANLPSESSPPPAAKAGK